ncbi:PREDICTED: WD repeat-containing protein YMR102C-like [Tarenaya hassleriana]|uniref:WD repeat-containing protein YMR102C-like n=1 Tax=Tarenaya hassleriana TaxID=28532 RepID=UPI00053C9B1D|nr:PREDICTED: WD repeat-containing protein YMR102C-like [Tarenaya hassleriana]
MGTCGDEEDEDWFFDAREEVSSVSDCNSEASEDFSCRLDQETAGLDLWTQNPDSVLTRRRRFFESMGFSFKRTFTDDYGDTETRPSCSDGGFHSDRSSVSAITNGSYDEHVDRVKAMELCRNESKSTASDDGGGLHSHQSSLSSLSNSLAESLRDSFEDHVRIFKGMDGEVPFVRNESSNSSSTAEGSSKSGSYGEFGNSYRESYEESTKKGSNGWLKKLSAITHVLDRHTDSNDRESVGSSPLRRISRVQSYKKQFKELSTLYVGQEFSAHDGSILTMKFSPDGKYLATAGEDCVVRVWEITENERADRFEVPDSDSASYAYFRMNGLGQIEPLNAEDEKTEKNRGLFKKKSSDMTCVVLPPRVFAISETPLNEFRGHKGEILDLSWSSEERLLLSSSVDETVRLWRLGSDECLKIFSHKNFVTCVAFNPVDDNYFISGSIDGKVRMWDVSRCRVVDYTDMRDIVTAICYSPDAKVAVVGTMTGDCRFYHILDDQLQLDREINFHRKKKVPSKRITGFQFFPGDTDKLMVTSADSQIRILSGDDSICKLKGSSLLLTTQSPTSAAFTSDGKHIVSTTEDSGVHVWSCCSQPNKKKPKKTIRSCESFLSHNTSIAVPWPVLGDSNSFGGFISSDMEQRLPPHFPSFECLRGSTTTWPEEKLPSTTNSSNSSSSSSRSKLKLLRSVCQNVCGSSPNLWGLVIVAATWDGKIRVFHNYGLPVHV